jgi:hypothetical protein
LYDEGSDNNNGYNMDDGSDNGRHDDNVGYDDNGSGNDASIQKRTAVAAVLDFADKEWESLKALREADGAEMSKGATADDNDNYTGALGTGTKMIGGKIDKGAV